jgi:Peptidase family C25
LGVFPNMRHLTLLIFFLLATCAASAQRTYSTNSVLSSGNWYKFSVKAHGVYRVDIAFLQSLGISVSGISSNNIRLYGNGGAMLPEANIENRPDDLVENAIWMVDGGDGSFNGSDYFLFYAPGPDVWQKDSLNQSFKHKKNLFANEAYYFISVGGATNGLRIPNRLVSGAANKQVSVFKDRYFYELDSLNFLKSGKEWYGEEFSNAPGRTLTKTFTVNFPNINTGSPISIVSSVAARSTGNGSSFSVRINGNQVLFHSMGPIGTGTYDPVAVASEVLSSFNTTQSSLSVQYNYQPLSVNAQGWLNWFELFPQRQLSMNGTDQLQFRDWTSVGAGNIAEYRLQSANGGTLVWDVTDPSRPLNMQGTLAGSEFRFNQTAERLREFVAFNNQNFLRPDAIGKIDNQNLHNSTTAQYLIVTHASLLSEAQRLATWHRQNQNLTTVVVTTEQVYNEFAGGTPDPSAIRDFVKMYYDKAGVNISNRPKYLLLFGDASYDYKNRIAGNSNLVPCFESESSLDPLSTYTSDDFFGFLDDADNVNVSFPLSLLDIGIGRIPARNLADAKNTVDKIIRYHEKDAFGPWRNEITLVADDEDNNLHQDDAELHAGVIQSKNLFHTNKVYLDMFRQQSGSGGSRYPDVNQVINNRIFSGTLIWNYSGHGGFRRLAEEVILDQEMVNSWSNVNKLPLFITATCDFAPYDDPSITSIGENILLRERTGAIALMTTTRVVFAFSNRIINSNYLQQALTPDANGVYPSLGDAVRLTKNITYTNFGDIINNRKFTLLGDPAVRVAFPKLKTKTTHINNQPLSADTLKALDRYTIKGEVLDLNGNKITSYNGNVFPVIYDKELTVRTLANDPGSLPVNVLTQNNVVFKGKAKVTNGEFTYTFVVPKDINYQFGNGKITYYVENGVTDGNGAEKTIIIGGASSNPLIDKRGPDVRGFMNDEKFVNGGITNEQPVLFLKLFDSSGINTVGTGIGHDITATLDNNNNRFFVLNDFYEADADSYQRGTVRFQMPKLEEGPHVLNIKVWDVANNSSDYKLEFMVVKDKELKLEKVYNYPNPFTTETTFMLNITGRVITYR